MSLFKRSKGTMIPQLEVPEDKEFDEIKKYKINKEKEEPEDMDFPLPKGEDLYLKIDENNKLEPIDESYLMGIFRKIYNYREGDAERFDNLLKIVKDIFENIAGSYYDLFDFSYKIAKKLEVTKEHIETCYKVLLEKKNATTLDLDGESLGALGRMISYSYTKIDQYKIKDMKKLEESVNKVIKDKINIYDDFIKWCVKEKKDQNKENITEFCKNKRKEYDCLPEVIFMVNKFSKIETVNLELDKICNPDLTDEEYKFFEIAVLNLNWILNSLKNIKFNLIYSKIQETLFNRYKEKINETCNKIFEVIKPKDIVFKDSFQKKWNFLGNLKPTKFAEKTEAGEVKQSKTLEIKGKKSIFSTKTFIKNIKKIATITEIFAKDKSDNITRVEIVKQNANFFEFLIICIFSLNEAKKGINVELVMNDTFNGEFFLLLKEAYKFEWITKEDTSEFHIFDLLSFNKIINNMDKLNIEFNCFDIITFEKILRFLYFNQTMTKLNMSLFSSDFMYIPEFIFKIYSEIFLDKSAAHLRRNFDVDTYLFCETKDMEHKILDQLYPNFVSNIATLFEIINKRKLITELGFNIDAPKNIVNKANYMNTIYKFILDVLYYATKNKINKLFILSPSTKMNSIVKPEINDIIKSINFNKNNKLEELTLQLNFVELESINSFILPNLKILNIGNLDLKTFEYLCNVFCSYQFNENSNLESLSISLKNSITDFNVELKKLFGKLFNVKIKQLESLTLLTNLDLSDKKEYECLLELLNYNWISKYIITFNDNAQEYNTDESIEKLKYLVPNKLSKKLLEKRNLEKIKDVKDENESAFWYLKYKFNKTYKKDDKNKIRDTKKKIFHILKFINIMKSPELAHIYSIKN